jgi:hypothetical protein
LASLMKPSLMFKRKDEHRRKFHYEKIVFTFKLLLFS